MLVYVWTTSGSEQQAEGLSPSCLCINILDLEGTVGPLCKLDPEATQINCWEKGLNKVIFASLEQRKNLWANMLQ